MPDLSIEALTGALALATVLLVFVTGLLAVANWRAASAAKRSADAVVREFRLTRRPRLTVKWEARRAIGQAPVHVFGVLRETAHVPTVIDAVDACVTRVGAAESAAESTRGLEVRGPGAMEIDLGDHPLRTGDVRQVRDDVRGRASGWPANHWRSSRSTSRPLWRTSGRSGVTTWASSAESVGEFWFGQVAKCVIQSDFQCPGGAEPRRPFGDHSGLSVEAFDNATGELPPGSEPVQNQVAVRAQPCGQPPSSGRAASASSGCTSGRGTGRPSTATRSPTAIESPP